MKLVRIIEAIRNEIRIKEVRVDETETFLR